MCIRDSIYAEGFPADKDLYDDTLAAEALKAAGESDKAVIFAGLPDSFESEGYDRSHMRLPECQNRLIAEILRIQPNTVIVLHNGSPVEMPWLSDVKGLPSHSAIWWPSSCFPAKPSSCCRIIALSLIHIY